MCQRLLWILSARILLNDMATMAAEYPNEYTVVGQIGTYYVNWNINLPLLP